MKVKLFFILLLVSVSLTFWTFWLPGSKVATDSPLISINSLKTQMDLPRTWNEDGTDGLGEVRVLTLWGWPLSFVSGVLANLNIDFSWQIRLLYLIPFIFLGCSSIWQFCKKFNLSDSAIFIASFFYLANTYILLVIDGGQLHIALAYAWFPACFLAVEKATGENLRKKILAGLAISLLGFFDLRFVLILFFVFLLRFFYGLLLDIRNWKDWLKKWINLGLIAGLLVFGLNFYWIYLTVQFPSKDNLYTSLTQTSFLNFATLGHALLALSPHWYRNIFGNVTPLPFEFILIPVLVFSAALFKKKNYWTGFWMIVSLSAAFMVKGALSPFPQVYPWLYSHIPGFSLFRDPTKFFFPLILSYCLLIGITINQIITKNKRIRYPVGFFLFGYFLILVSPVWLGKMNGIFSIEGSNKQDENIRQELLSDTSYSRVFWIPSVPPLGLVDPSHPPVEASRMVSKRPFASGVKGTYELFNFLREAPYMGEIFDIAGIGYIAYPQLDLTKGNYSADEIKYYQTFSDQLSNLPWLTKVANLPVFKVKQHQAIFFVPRSTWLVVGSDGLYNEATKSANLNLSDNAYIFSEESGLGSKADQLKGAKFILYKKSLTDLAADFLNKDELFFPAGLLKKDPDTSGWWKRDDSDLIDWRYFIKTKYGLDNQDFSFGGGWAVSEGDGELKFHSKNNPANSVLLARVMESSKSGTISFYQTDKLVGEISTKSNDTNVRWFEVGKLSENNQFVIRSQGDINVVNALAILPLNEWERLKSKADDLDKKGSVVRFEDIAKRVQPIQPSKVNVSYEKISATLYRVKLTNVTGPTSLVFSESYNPYWKINGQEATKAYSLINSFEVTKDGEYDVEFTVQNGVGIGLAISITIFVGLVILLLYQKDRYNDA